MANFKSDNSFSLLSSHSKAPVWGRQVNVLVCSPTLHLGAHLDTSCVRARVLMQVDRCTSRRSTGVLIVSSLPGCFLGECYKVQNVRSVFIYITYFECMQKS